jgi:hypothetical protein
MVNHKSIWVETPSVNQVKVATVDRFIHETPWDGSYAVFNMMIYGEPGEGKTPLVCSVTEVEQMMPALLIDCDNGTLSARNRRLKTVHIAEMAAQMTLETGRSVTPWRAFEEIYKWLLFGEHDIKTVIIDGGTDLERFCELECITFGIENKKSSEHDTELAELQDYRRIQERMKRAYIRFRDLVTRDGRRVNLIATAHESKKKDDNSGKLMIQPLFLGKGSTIIPSVFDIIARLRHNDAGKQELIPYLLGNARGRDRSFSLGKVIAEPTMKKIVERIFEVTV